MIDPELEAEIHRLRLDYLARATPSIETELASKLQALPVLEDMGGVSLLQEAGAVLVVPWDASPDQATRASLKQRIVALVAAAERHASLSRLLPERTSEAQACADCNGEGRRRPADEVGSLRCATCCGMGWI